VFRDILFRLAPGNLGTLSFIFAAHGHNSPSPGLASLSRCCPHGDRFQCGWHATRQGKPIAFCEALGDRVKRVRERFGSLFRQFGFFCSETARCRCRLSGSVGAIQSVVRCRKSFADSQPFSKWISRFSKAECIPNLTAAEVATRGISLKMRMTVTP
jgi:hypothetical protein